MRNFTLSFASASLIALAVSAHAAETPVAAAPADASAADPGEEAIVVTAAKADVTADAGTKSSLAIAETPQSISLISAQDIAKLGLANLNQALRYVAGVTPETRGANAELYDQFTLRGFTVPVYLDGLKQFGSSSGYAEPQVDLSRIENIEVVKGPASALYGQSSPGGLVAMSSKLPLDQAYYGSVAATYGSYDLYRVDADVGGKLSDTVAVRVYGSANGAHTEQYFGSRVRQTISGALTWKITPDTTLTVLGAYSHDPKNGNYSGQPGYGTLFYNPNGPIDTKYADGEPGDFYRREQTAGTYILNHDFGSGWKFRASGRYQHVGSDLGGIYETGVPVDATFTTFGRGSYATHEQLKNWTFDNQLTGKVVTGPITHDLLLGVDYQTAHSLEIAAFGSADNINAYDPVYGTQPVPQTPYTTPGYGEGYATPGTYDYHLYQTGIYAQDTMSWGGLRLIVSGRHDWAKTTDITDTAHDRKFTGRAGLLYKTDFGLAPYVSYATSFEPQLSVLESGGLAKPSMGKQLEVGAKFQPPGSPILISAAWYHITQTGVLTTSPISFASTQTGKYRSEGFEIEANAPLPYGFNVHAAYNHQHVRDISDANPDAVGGGLIGAGDGNLAATVEWTAKQGLLKSLNVGGGVRHVDRVYAGLFDPALLRSTGFTQYYSPSYTVFDAMLHYDLVNADQRLKGVTLALNVTNLFDRKYLTSCYLYPQYDAWCWYGNRRTVQGTIAFHW